MADDNLQQVSFVALAPFLRDDSRVLTLGVRPTLGDYSTEERRLLREARCVLFPTVRFADVLEAGGCRCFPSAATYRYQRWRPQQWILAAFLNLPRVQARVGYGKKVKRDVPLRFSLPFRVAGPHSHKDPVVLVKSWREWHAAAASLKDPWMVMDWAPYRWRDEVWVACSMVVARRTGIWNGVDEPLWLPWVAVFQTDPEEELLRFSLKVCQTAHIDEAVVCWGRLDGSPKVFFEGLQRPPPFMQHKGERRDRHRIAFWALLQSMPHVFKTPFLRPRRGVVRRTLTS
ncbi:hypothetical protein [Desulfosoma caldarium]|uniref:Uncharacterized protein n=1 Tax=Desulfosoma caldarium TaxID=610254 RepID=A0A3N1VHS2_9BACT|nr:hypothetical protein [Desulfosoma caldarium]ROR01569.1 hypothetical protein EDC27_0748 [Desulfosoma caldarium]